MGNSCAKCLEGGPPPTVFTVCPADGKAHDFGGRRVNRNTLCLKCGQSKGECEHGAMLCQQGEHDWVEDYEPVGAPTVVPVRNAAVAVAVPSSGKGVVAEATAVDGKPMKPPAAVAHGTPVQEVQLVEPIYGCKRCGLRRRTDAQGVVLYDDYYMYGGGYMMGMEMGIAFGIMGAHAYAMDAFYMEGAYDDGAGDGGMWGDDDMDGDGGGLGDLFT